MKRPRLRLLLSLLLLVGLLLLTGCAATVRWSGLRIGSITSQTGDSVYHACMEWNGQVVYTIHVREKDQPCLRGDVTLTEGTLSVVLEKKNGETLFRDVLEADRQLTMVLPKAGTYRIRLEAEGFAGEYRFSWGDE